MTTARRVAVLGATGTIGRAVVAALLARGDKVVCLTRVPQSTSALRTDIAKGGASVRSVDFTSVESIQWDGFSGQPFDAVISCMASRTGVPADAWAVDHAAHVATLQAALASTVEHFILLSAICVQKPKLAFQYAKLAFERELTVSGIRYSIVRPTAFFKSLSGQVARVQAGKPFLLFGDGTLTACKPISDRDLAAFLVGCLDNKSRWNAILPIGGPGPAITPREQGEMLFGLLGRSARFRSVPLTIFNVMANGLGAIGRIVPPLAAKAELARIGHYYATESMLVLNPETGNYDAAVTPSTGTDTLVDHYRAMLAGRLAPQLGDHAVF